MRELTSEMLPLAVENELSKDWTLICEKYWRFRKNADTLCLHAKEFPTSRQTQFVSSRTGLEWHIICTYTGRSRQESYYQFYTPYTNSKGKKGCYTLSEGDCEKLTVHYLDRVRTRFLHPRGIYPKTLEETMEAYCRHVQDGGSFLFISSKTHQKYMVLKNGVAIVDVAGNGLITYITFVTFDMLLQYQTPYKRVVERMYELYEQNGKRWDLDRFENILNEEGLSPDEDKLTQIKTLQRRHFTEPPRIRTRLDGLQTRDYDRAMQQLGESAARQWTPAQTQRPDATTWIDPADLQKGVEELMRQRKGK